MDVVDGLPGRYVTSWDTRARPVPENVQLIQLRDVSSRGPYMVALCHNISDLISIKHLDVPRVVVLHTNLNGRIAEEGCTLSLSDMQDTMRTYVRLVGAVVIAVSETKLASWGVPGKIIEPPIDSDDYGGYTGEIPRGIRVSNFITKRAHVLALDVYKDLTRDVEMTLVGSNPDIPGSEPARNWDHLRELLQTHRYYVHTARPGLEDGYNLALLEAMGTGLPVISTSSPTSPVLDGESGFVSDDLSYLRWGIKQLIDDPELARRMGERARNTVLSRFSMSKFLERWHDAIREAQARQKRTYRKPRRAAH